MKNYMYLILFSSYISIIEYYCIFNVLRNFISLLYNIMQVVIYIVFNLNEFDLWNVVDLFLYYDLI